MNFDKYRSPHEPQHHWELKKAFMLAHKDTFSESELVGLAMTLANVEFLGCFYPPDTMRRIAELSKGIVEEFREKSRGKIKRTFVSGSDAANSKVNRLNPIVNKGSSGSGGSAKPLLTKYGNFVS